MGMSGKGINLSDLQKLPKVTFTSSEWKEYVTEQQPVVVKRITLLKKSDHIWDEDFLIEQADGDALFTCFSSKSGQMVTDKSLDTTSLYYKGYTCPTKRIRLTASQLKRIKEFKNRQNYYMLQDILRVGLGPKLEKQFAGFQWDVVDDIRKVAGFGKVTSHELCVWEPKCYRPAHYDEQDTIHAQMSGKRRVIVFHPAAYATLYPYPVTHPADKYSQLGEHIENGTCPGPNYPRFPWAAEYGRIVDLHPNEVLFLPSHWWLHDLAPTENCTSMILWCKPNREKQEIQSPTVNILTAANMVTVRRNIEKFMIDKIGALNAHKLWCCLERGRVPKSMNLEKMNSYVEEVQKITNILLSHTKSWLLIKETVQGRFNNQKVDCPELEDSDDEPSYESPLTLCTRSLLSTTQMDSDICKF